MPLCSLQKLCNNRGAVLTELVVIVLYAISLPFLFITRAQIFSIIQERYSSLGCEKSRCCRTTMNGNSIRSHRSPQQPVAQLRRASYSKALPSHALPSCSREAATPPFVLIGFSFHIRSRQSTHRSTVAAISIIIV